MRLCSIINNLNIFLILMNFSRKLDSLLFGATPPPPYRPNERPTLALLVASTSYKFVVHFFTHLCTFSTVLFRECSLH